ncbi:hypothetical protein BD769DRAFT_1395332 [Suillus cothurnatus]|nr:hypothetical protein BD769DRAFT_1395332 [Suillus cothurnatus]
MSSSPPLHIPHSTTSDHSGHVFTCPNCADTFASNDNIIRHLSTTVTCSQQVVQGLTLDFNHDNLEYEQDVYGEYEEVDPLDDAEEDGVFVSNPPSTIKLDYDTPIVSVNPSAGPHPRTLRDYHPNVPVTHPGGKNHLQKMDCDIHATIHHTENLYYPFAL